MQHPAKKNIRKRNKALIASALCLALVLAAAFVLLLPAIEQRYPAKPPVSANEPTLQTLYTRSAEEVERIFLNGFVLCQKNGELMLEKENGPVSIDEAYAADLMELATLVAAQDTVAASVLEVEDHLAEMGLDPAQQQMRVHYTDGTETLLEIGAPIPNTPYFYFRFSETDGIYMADSGMTDTLGLTSKRLLPVIQPDLTASLVDGLSITNASGQSIYAFAGGTSGALLSPLVYPISDDTAQALLTALDSFRLGTKEADATAENCQMYGMNDPLCVLDIHQQSGTMATVGTDGALKMVEAPEKELRFVIGREEGEFFYTCEYDGSIYLISRFLAETLVKADWKTLLSRTPANMGDALIDSICIETEQGTLDYQITRKEKVLANNELELDENGIPVYETSVRKNGQACSQEELNELLDRLNSLTAAGTMPGEQSVLEEPRWRITLSAEGETRVLEGFKLDAFSDALAVNGTAVHYLHSDAIDSLMSGLV